MQTNTKAKTQLKRSNWVLTPEIMALSLFVVAAFVISVTALRDTSTLEPIANIEATRLLQADLNNTQLMSDTFDFTKSHYAQHINTLNSEEIATFSN